MSTPFSIATTTAADAVAACADRGDHADHTDRAPVTVYTDTRWPAATGIHNVMAAYAARVPSNIRIVPLPVGGGVAHPLSPLALSRALRKLPARNAVFWNPGFVPAAWPGLPSVVVVHDLTHRHFYTRAHRLYYDTVLRPLYRRCSAIVCVSAFTRDEFLAWSGMPPERVHVIHNGTDDAYTHNRDTLGHPFPYVLYPGNRRNYKNLHRLIEAFGASGLVALGVRLMLTGAPDPALLEHAARHRCADALTFAGVVPNDAMPKLYRGALFVAFVSRYEGFGLPILEAMASDVPVLTSRVSGMPEVAGSAAMLVDPASVADIAAAMRRLGTDAGCREALVARGREQLRRFSWDDSACRFWKLIEQVGASG
ncbi:glycosyltransferase family 4 protein [Burkholderia vietnamiensis]|uniref:glycosyltransferase family 4 protein n=1 Tax=Burkholderia vietnamiensis TaxID=60552 RepID=UPI001B8F7D40|nr:glycosyltransferase family 1 protein [Burkholderia vietnamiensis]MBR8149355.1 glycosyltransferase family 4 protein [Burkholderia vietnamiensis]